MAFMLQDLAGMPPAPPPLPGTDPNSLLQLLQLGSVDQRHRLLQRQFDTGGEVAGGAPVDYAHGKGTPLLLAGLANLVSSGVGGYQQGKALQGERSLLDEQMQGRSKLAQSLLGGPTPDLAGVLSASPEDLPARASAAQDAIAGQRRSGLMALLSGDPTFASAGKEITGGADRAQAEMLGMPQQRQQLAMTGADLAAKLRSAAAKNSPIVAGAGAQLLKRLNIDVPPGATAAEVEEILPAAEKAAAIPKVMSVAPGSDVVDARTGKKLSSGAGGAGGLLSPEALDRQAALYNKTGELPSFGRANATVHGAILQRAAELANGSDLAGSHAANKADAASLKRLQVQADSIDSFETTALKNLDNFLSTAKDISDTGIPLANKPIRKIADSLAGSPAQAQFNAARQVAIQEIGKVLGGAVAGGVVSDSQRHEVEGLMRGDATLEQLQAVAQTLKQDMANRKAAVGAQLDAVRGRLSGKPTTTEAPADGGRVRRFTRDASGKLVEVK